MEFIETTYEGKNYKIPKTPLVLNRNPEDNKDLFNINQVDLISYMELNELENNLENLNLFLLAWVFHYKNLGFLDPALEQDLFTEEMKFF